MLHKKKPLTITIKQNRITFMYMLLNTAISANFEQLSTYETRVQYTVTVVKAILF